MEPQTNGAKIKYKTTVTSNGDWVSVNSSVPTPMIWKDATSRVGLRWPGRNHNINQMPYIGTFLRRVSFANLVKNAVNSCLRVYFISDFNFHVFKICLYE